MIADTTLRVGDTVRTPGYTSVGDGGGNTYQIVAAGTGTEDGGEYIDLSTHQAKGLFPGVMNVKQWGAVGDYVADDTAAIQAAVTYGVDNDVATFIPSGDYLITSSITASGNDVTIIGECMETTALQCSTALTGVAIDINSAGLTRYNRGKISDLKIVGTRTGAGNWYDYTHYTTHGIRVNETINGFLIERVRVVRTLTAGIELTGNTWFNTIRDCFVEECIGKGYVLGTNSNGVHVDACRAYRCTEGMDVNGCFGLNLSGIGLEDTLSWALRIRGESVVNVIGTWFEDHGMVTTTEGAIYVTGVTGDTTRPTQLNVTGCFFSAPGGYVVKGANAKILVAGCRDYGTDNIYDLDADCGLDDADTNFWNTTGTLYGGAGGTDVVYNCEGTWTPVVADAYTGGNTGTFDANATSQKWFKRGNLVTVIGRIENIDTTGMTAGNAICIQGLPFSFASTDYSTGTVQTNGVTVSGTHLVAVTNPSTTDTTIFFYDVNNAGNRSSLKVSDISGATDDMFFQITYSI